jgi:hypothetical protein
VRSGVIKLADPMVSSAPHFEGEQSAAAIPAVNVIAQAKPAKYLIFIIFLPKNWQAFTLSGDSLR